MNKRADFSSIIIMIVIVFALAVAALIFSKVFLDITGEMKEIDKFGNESISAIETVETHTIPLLDLFIFFLLIGSIIGLIISSIYVDVHPALTFVFILLLIIAIFLAAQFTNVFTEISETDQLASTASEFTYTNLILGTHFPVIIVVVGIIVVIILYGKSKRVGDV